jgi:hypothetical protein
MDLLCYEGDEIYLQNEPKLTSKTYKEAIFAYETSTVIGLKKSGKILINPPMDIIIDKDDEVIAISEDDDTVILSGKTNFDINQQAIVKKERVSSTKKEKNLILGWNSHAFMTISELDEYLSPNSELVIVHSDDISEIEFNNLQQKLNNQTITVKKGDYSKRNVLLELDVPSFDNIIILANENKTPQVADAVTLLALIHLRNIAKENNKDINIISEMFDQKNRELAEVTEANDFIISHDLISRLLAQVSETKDIKTIFDILFDSEGSEIYLKDATDYIELNKNVNFYTVLESASFKNETAIGYRIMKYAFDAEKNYGIVINPNKNQEIKFSEEDKIIVLSED